MKMRKILSALLLLLSGCSSDVNIRKEMLANVRNGRFDTAAETVFAKDYMSSKSDRFVREAERGSLHYMQGHYYQALKHFDHAADIAKQLFTISVSKMAGAQIFGDTMTDYAGEIGRAHV